MIVEREPFNWSGSWVWEIGAAVLGTVCIALLTGFLAYANDNAYASWQYSVSPNAVISIIVTAAKAVILSLVTSCMHQPVEMEPIPTANTSLSHAASGSGQPWFLGRAEQYPHIYCKRLVSQSQGFDNHQMYMLVQGLYTSGKVLPRWTTPLVSR